MEELWDVVDKFVITEANVTFTKQPKVMYFREGEDRFEKYRDKIIYLETDLSNADGGAWNIESIQRDYFVKNMDFHDSDVFIVGDVDEIPNVKIIENVLSEITEYNFCSLIQTLHYYYVNCKAINRDWRGTFVITGSGLRGSSPTWWRYRKGRRHGTHRVSNGGWHFSYLGTPEKVLKKMEACFLPDGEKIKETSYSIEHVAMCIEKHSDIFNRPLLRFKIDNNQELPRYLVENKERFSHLFYVENNEFRYTDSEHQ